MAVAGQILGDLVVSGQLQAATILPGLVRRTDLQSDTGTFRISLLSWRVWDALISSLPAAAANDDLGLIQGTFGTNSPTIQAGDLKAAGATTRYARTVFSLPAEYVSGSAITIRTHAGMKTTVSDGTATIDVECYKSDDEEGIGSDLCATAAQSINSLTDADKDFTITPTGLVAGDTLDIRIAVAVNDAATATAVIAVVGSVDVLCGVKG